MKSNILKIGSGKIGEIEKTLSESGEYKKLLYVYDPYVDSLYGSLVRPQINSIGNVKEQIVSNNTITYAMEVAERVIATDIDCIIAIGGGKTLDVAKYAAFISKRPFLSIPTTMSHDGIVSPIAVLKRQDGKPKSLGCAMPSMMIMDTELMVSCPEQLIKAGIGDTISNYMALKDWELAVLRGKDEMNGYAYMMSRTALDALIKTQFDHICTDFLSVLANSLVLSGIAMDYAGSSRPVSGSEHLFSHALDYYCEKQNLHGLNVALGTVAVLKIIGLDSKEVINYLKKFEVDVNPVHMGISEDVFVYCMKHATEMRTNRYTYLHEADLDETKLKNVYQELINEL
ncbi:iron-containing alcohol dehydrogenase family protein [Butyrivibrio sp.]|uniref:iron-containing alcohol dehydrogenase family protein n=1 Tax=Butyrivibrio sp. TaxID=28121 RepID=UPI0025B7B398|nr:iron-containing alcohol dehydrogenase family protein [Butyrivibrio sp.]MBE5838004.1 iron-containing alcohol dehydrogenase family protein [Butyrivibrio sp.]